MVIHCACSDREVRVKKLGYLSVFFATFFLAGCGTVYPEDIKSRHILRYVDIHTENYKCCMAAMDRANKLLTFLKINKLYDSGCVDWNKINRTMSFAYSAIQDARYVECTEWAHDVSAYVEWELDYIDELRAIHYDL